MYCNRISKQTFTKVRIHTEARAREIAQGLNSQAFTVGRDIFFSKEYYAPGTGEGKRLLADQSVPQSLERGREIANMDGGAFEVAQGSRAEAVGRR